MSDNDLILKVSNLSKRFGGVQALKDISLEVRYGEVHALVGENGAGKSTLMNVLGGIIHRDTGEVIYKGNSVAFDNPTESLKAGVAIIHQELAMLPSLNVIDNLFMGRMELKGGAISWRRLEALTRQCLQQVGLDVDPYSIIRDLSISQRQLIEIAKAVSMNASLIIMDEPNSSLSESDTERLFQVIEQLKQNNVAVIYVSHKIKEVLHISDRISVLRDGQYIGTVDKKNATVDLIIEMMVGRKLLDRIANSRQPLRYSGFTGGKPERGGLSRMFPLPCIEVKFWGLPGWWAQEEAKLPAPSLALQKSTAGAFSSMENPFDLVCQKKPLPPG